MWVSGTCAGFDVPELTAPRKLSTFSASTTGDVNYINAHIV
jgi:hypothetical protein